MQVRAKLRLSHITERNWGGSEPQRTLRFDCQYDQSIPEDQRFAKATPSGFIELQVDNPAALVQFKVGQTYYVDFTPAE